MKERPILFGGAMVRAILDGRKTQTRRVMKPQPIKCLSPTPNFEDTEIGDIFLCPDIFPTGTDGAGWVFVECERPGIYHHMGTKQLLEKRCPYGVPGDQLWVRETFNKCGCFVCEDHWPKRGTDHGVTYREGYRGCSGLSWTRSIFMPRWASRLTLEITDIRVQRVQEISEEDAKAEGVTTEMVMNAVTQSPNPLPDSYWVGGFRWLWDSINAKRGFGWEKNPWVWAVTLKRVTA